MMNRASNNDCLSFRSGEVIFREGERGNFNYRVISGEVHIEYDWNIIDVVPEGGLISEMTINKDEIIMATVVAATDCVLAPAVTQQFFWALPETMRYAS